MAIDTAVKRRAMAPLSLFGIGSGVTPNAAKDETWRRQTGGNYAPLTVDPGGGGSAYDRGHRSRDRSMD